MKQAFGILLIGLSLVFCAYAATFANQTQPETVHGQLVFYCEYKGLKLLGKSKFKDYEDCVLCRCNKGGLLSCHDLTFNVHYDEAASECINVSIACKNKWVMKNNTTATCPKNKIPQFGATGK